MTGSMIEGTGGERQFVISDVSARTHRFEDDPFVRNAGTDLDRVRLRGARGCQPISVLLITALTRGVRR